MIKFKKSLSQKNTTPNQAAGRTQLVNTRDTVSLRLETITVVIISMPVPVQPGPGRPGPESDDDMQIMNILLTWARLGFEGA